MPVQRVCPCPEGSTVVSCSWDKTCCLWSPTTNAQPQIKIILPGRAYALDYQNFHVSVGTADHCVYYYDLRNTSQPQDMIRTNDNIVTCTTFLPNLSGMVAGFVEGLFILKMFNQQKGNQVYDQRITRKNNQTQRNQMSIHGLTDIHCNNNGYFVTAGLLI